MPNHPSVSWKHPSIAGKSPDVIWNDSVAPHEDEEEEPTGSVVGAVTVAGAGVMWVGPGLIPSHPQSTPKVVSLASNNSPSGVASSTRPVGGGGEGRRQSM